MIQQKERQASLPKADERESRPPISYLIDALRPKQWTKNLIIFIPIIFAAKATDLNALVATAAFAVIFCAASSSVYLINDLLDRKQDSIHPLKRRRPIASGRISLPVAITLSVMLALSSLILSFFLRPALALIILAYLFLNVLYGKVLKHQVLLDVMSVSAGFVLRAVGGCLVARVPQSGWLLLCTSFGALFLALEKRRHELMILEDNAYQHRPSLLRYSESLLNRIESVVLPAVLISYILYSFLSWHGQWMMITVPFVFYGLVRYQLLSSGGILTGTPEEVLLKDRPIQLTIVFWLVAAAGVLYGFIPQSCGDLCHWLDSIALTHF